MLRTISIAFTTVVLLANLSFAETTHHAYAIHIVDDQTARGVPLVEIRTVSNVTFLTDSAGYVAIDDPALMDRKVFFTITSHGYEFPADGFGMHGVALDLKPGGEITLKIKRHNLAERLYRVTGEGIYRDSVMLGKPVPIAEPLLSGQVTGQDSTLNVVYHGKLWWFWGDTMRQSYPLGHFSTAGATSELPGHGGLDPAVGVNLKYFVDENGFSRPMVPATGGELHWIDGVITLKDDDGHERMLAVLMRLKSMNEILARELIVFNDERGTFDTLKVLDLKSPFHLGGHPFRHKVDGVEYIYCGQAAPNIRVKGDWKSVIDPAAYESYTENKSVWSWGKQELKADETMKLRDITTGESFEAHYGSVCWNAYRNKWVMIVVQRGGKSSFLGEVWYAEADAPEGPWKDARKILTHDRYSFYNPVQHPEFEQEGGRYIYFEGTYATTFSKEENPTPRYDYNQMMYRIDLSEFAKAK
jgi:hypothetical protein